MAVELPGHNGSPRRIEDQDLFSYAKYVEEIVREQNEPVILAGHSLGGMIISQAAEYCPDRIKTLVYVCAFLPRNGESADGPTALRVTDWSNMANMGFASVSEDGKVVALAKDFAINGCFNDLPKEEAEEAYSLLCPEATASQYQAAQLGESFSRVPKAYIRCLKDKSIPLELQDRMLSATPCDRTYSLNTGHSPFLADPKGLAEIFLTEGRY
jgi:pimeloyl-ACP methyl ester carboxylesterase